MINLKNMSDESGFFAVTAIAICVVLVVGIVGLLTPAAASPSVSTNNSATYATPRICAPVVAECPLWVGKRHVANRPIAAVRSIIKSN